MTIEQKSLNEMNVIELVAEACNTTASTKIAVREAEIALEAYANLFKLKTTHHKPHIRVA